MIQWKDEYRVNVPIIDEQHKRLFEIAISAEQLILLPHTTDKFDDIIEIINQLKDYMVFHLNTEQNMLQEIKYNKYLSHIVMHNDFVEKMNSLDVNKIDDNQDKYLSDILTFIMEWLTQHVLTEDMAWSEYYHENF